MNLNWDNTNWWNKKNIIALGIALIVALGVFLFIDIFAQKTVQRIIIAAKVPASTHVIVSTVSNSGKVAAIGSMDFKSEQPPKHTLNGTQWLNTPLSRLQLEFVLKDTSSTDRSLSILNIQAPMPYSTNYYFGIKQIPLHFKSAQSTSDTHASYEFDANTNKVTIRSLKPIGDPNRLLVLGVSTLFFFGIWFLIRNSAWGEIPAFKDMSLGNHISSTAEFNAINGLRGVAALLVLLSHSTPQFHSVQMGLALLFVISGFLLSKPFVLDSSKIFSVANIERYITKRLKRILPMYYLFVVITYVFSFKFDVAIRHFLFIQAEGHLWPMTQIFAFYMLLPFILLICCAAYKLNRLLPLILLSVATYFSVTAMSTWEPFFNGEYSHKFFLYAFLMGVAASYVQYDLIGKRKISNTLALQSLGVAALVITIMTILWSAPVKPPYLIQIYISQFYVKCLLAVAIILLALNTPNSFYSAIISNWLFRSVGIVGFSFYILHGLGMRIASEFARNYLGASGDIRSFAFAAGAFCVTYIMAIAAYSYVERPFFGYRKQSATS